MRPSFVDDQNRFHYDVGSSLTMAILVNVHPPEACAGRHCVIHNPSDHGMRDWPLNWRPYDGLVSIKPSHFERICPHGVGHPDPDDMEYHTEVGQDYVGIHGCDGCCRLVP